MDIEKLIDRLSTESLYADKASLEIMELCMEAATALSTLQAENKRLNKIVCSIPTTPDSGRTVSQYDKEMSMCAYLDDLEAENEKLRAELEQAKRLYESEKEDFIDFACSGVPNLTPYCLNRHPDCVDERGWCRTEKCRGFSRERGQKED